MVSGLGSARAVMLFVSAILLLRLSVFFSKQSPRHVALYLFNRRASAEAEIKLVVSSLNFFGPLVDSALSRADAESPVLQLRQRKHVQLFRVAKVVRQQVGAGSEQPAQRARRSVAPNFQKQIAGEFLFSFQLD